MEEPTGLAIPRSRRLGMTRPLGRRLLPALLPRPARPRKLSKPSLVDGCSTVSAVLPHTISRIEDVLDTSRGEAIGELHLLDGTHRVAALSELLSDSTQSRDYFSKLTVLVWERVDGQKISALEVLWLSSVLNSTSSTARKPCFLDFIVKSMSIATVVDDENCLKSEPKGSSAGVAKLVD